MHTCGDSCCCDVGRYKDSEIGAQSKLIPYDRLQDVRTELPAGGTRRITQICCICPVEEGEMIGTDDVLATWAAVTDALANQTILGLSFDPLRGY